MNPSRLVVCIAIAGLTAGASAKLPAAPGHAQETTKPTPAKASPLDAILAEPEVTLLADGFRFTEGPCWHDGALYFCDLQASKLYKWTPDNSTEEAWDGEASVFLDDSAGAAGIFVDRQGRMVVTHFGQKVTRSNDEGGFDTIADECDGKPLGSANDLVVAADGTIYFTNPNRGDSSTSGVCRLDTDGTVSLIVNDTAFPNGVHLSPDGKTLYFTQYAKNIVKAVELADDGSAGEVRTFIDLSEAGGRGRTDGMAIDATGRIYCTGPGGVWVLTPEGASLGVIKVPGGASNCAFGGADGKTLFITSGDSVYRIATKTGIAVTFGS